MNDTLEFFKLPPNQRPDNYYKLVFSMMYFFNELYILPFSHDEVVLGKATLIQKMWGDYENKFPQAKALYLYIFLIPARN
jgi:1,4-alpha-glucan branching enzyme